MPEKHGHSIHLTHEVNLPTDLDTAVADYLHAVEGYQTYLKATQNLFDVFAKGWGGSRRSLMESFTDFQKMLVGGDQSPTAE